MSLFKKYLLEARLAFFKIGGIVVCRNKGWRTIALVLGILLASHASADDKAGSETSFWCEASVAVDNARNVYVADLYTIRKITPAGKVKILVGTQGVPCNVGNLHVGMPRQIATDHAGNLYVAEYFNSVIRKITPRGVVKTLAGSERVHGHADGTGAKATFSGPGGIATDRAGNVYVADTLNNTIRKITPAGVVTTLAGAAGKEGYVDAVGPAARFTQPSRVATDRAGNVYVLELNGDTIRRITPAGAVTTLDAQAGTGYVPGGDGAGFNNLTGLAVDKAGSIYVADTGDNAILKITPAGAQKTLAGNTAIAPSELEPGTPSSVQRPVAVATDNAGNVYVATSDRIRKIAPQDAWTFRMRPAHAETFKPDEKVYVTEARVNVRSGQFMSDSPVATLPIGTQAKVCGSSSNPDWLCLSMEDTLGSDSDGLAQNSFYGVAPAAMFGHKRPRLEALLAGYDKTPRGRLDERRRWAERAITLEPSSQEAQKRLIEILTEIGDRRALAAAEASFASYQAHQPAVPKGKKPEVFIYSGGTLMPFAEPEPGSPTRAATHSSSCKRGQFYYVYSRGRRVGTVVTAIQWNCEDSDAWPVTWTNSIDAPDVAKLKFAIAANTDLPEKYPPAPEITDSQKVALEAMMKAQINSRHTGKARKLLLRELSSGKPWARTGRLAPDGRIFLVGNLAVGSTSDAQYSGSVYAAVLVIAEQQADGTFKMVDSKALGRLAEDGCHYAANEDLDGDGTDEIILDCEAIEMSGSYGLLKRIGNHWRKTRHEVTQPSFP